MHAVPEGRVVLPNEPLIEVTAPIAEAQLVETFLLNHVTFQTAIATKAARCRLAAGDRIDLVDFALRRTHGVDAGMAVARLSAMAGFAATSNVEAARRYGLQPAGTMAHSYIEAFACEADAFRAYAQDRPAARTFLVDTYDTLDGVRTAIDVIRELGSAGPLAVRLDSGDIAVLARQTRRLLDEAGLAHVEIFASGGLDEYDLERLRRDGVPVDAAGVGTKLGVSADAPYLDSAYKLVAYGDRPAVPVLADALVPLVPTRYAWRPTSAGSSSPRPTRRSSIAPWPCPQGAGQRHRRTGHRAGGRRRWPSGDHRRRHDQHRRHHRGRRPPPAGTRRPARHHRRRDPRAARGRRVRALQRLPLRALLVTDSLTPSAGATIAPLVADAMGRLHGGAAGYRQRRRERSR